MLKANIKLPIWLGVIAIVVSITFTTFLFNALVIIIYLGTIYIIVYFTLGYIKKEDAIIIDNQFIKVRTPFKYTEWKIAALENLYLVDNTSTIKAQIIIEEEYTEVTICTNIYDKSVNEIYSFLIKNHPELQIT